MNQVVYLPATRLSATSHDQDVHRCMKQVGPVGSISGKSMAIVNIWAAIWQNHQNGCAPSKDSDQPGHPPSPIRVFAVRMKNAGVFSYPLSAHRRLWSDWADAQADLSLRWAHTHFVGFVMSRLKYICLCHSPEIVSLCFHTSAISNGRQTSPAYNEDNHKCWFRLIF